MIENALWRSVLRFDGTCRSNDRKQCGHGGHCTEEND